MAKAINVMDLNPIIIQKYYDGQDIKICSKTMPSVWGTIRSFRGLSLFASFKVRLSSMPIEKTQGMIW